MTSTFQFVVNRKAFGANMAVCITDFPSLESKLVIGIIICARADTSFYPALTLCSSVHPCHSKA